MINKDGVIKRFINNLYPVKVFRKRGFSNKPPKIESHKIHGNFGELDLQDELNPYPNVFYNKFVDNISAEIDAILIHNNHIIIIEMKNWTGTVSYNDNTNIFYQDNGYEKNKRGKLIKTLNWKASQLSKTINSKIFIDSILVFSNETNIDLLSHLKNNIVNLSNLNEKIKEITKTPNNMDPSLIEKISNLAEWDIVIDKHGSTHEVLILNEKIRLLLYKDGPTVEVDVNKISSIETCLQKMFKKDEPDKIIIKYKKGHSREFYSYKSKISYFNWNNSNKKNSISLSLIKTIHFSPTRPDKK